MNVKKNIIQFLPYFPPHIGGVEKVGQEFFGKWTHGKSSVISGNVGQKTSVYNQNNNSIIDNKKIDFYPSFDIVDNFPVPNIWTLRFWKVLSSHKKEIQNSREEYYIITHTRFFLSSFIGGLFYRFLPSQGGRKLRWIHIEHGSDYVQLSSPLKNKIAYIYDRIIGKWIFKRADRVLAISQASKRFIVTEFWRKDVEVWYRGIDFPVTPTSHVLKDMFPNKKIVGYIGRLYKWKNVDSLCSAYLSLDTELLSQMQLVIIGGGEDYKELSEKYASQGIYFTGEKSFQESFALQGEFDIHVHPSSPGGGLATTLLQAMHHGSMIVATPYEGAAEVIENDINGILLQDDSREEIQKGIELAYKSLSNKDIFFQRNKDILMSKFSRKNNIQKLYDLL